MLKPIACVIALSIAGMVIPLPAGAKEGGVRKDALQAVKEAAKGNDEVRPEDRGGVSVLSADDKGGGGTRPTEPGDDRGRLGLDDDVRNCYVYAPPDQMPKPYLRFRSAADKARLEAEATLLSAATVIYADEIAQFHDLNDDSAPTFSLKAEQFRLSHRLGARGCSF